MGIQYMTLASLEERGSIKCFKVNAGIIGPGKKWKHIPVSANGKALIKRLHVKLGETVVVIAGDDKGLVGSVTSVFPKRCKIKVKGVNIVTKHSKGTQGSTKGTIG